MRRALLVCACLIPALAAHADPPAELLEAHAVVGRWLDAQNARNFADYTALYGDGFQGIKRTTGGKESKLDLAGWKADRQKMFKGKDLRVEIYAETYQKGEGGVTVTFHQIFREGKYADAGDKTLLVAGGKIVREEITGVSKVHDEVQVGPGYGRSDDVIPASFAKIVFSDWGGNCDKKQRCDAFLQFGPSETAPRVPLGKHYSDFEGESTGDYALRLRVFPIGAALLVVAEDVAKDNLADLQSRHATLIGPGPKYERLWDGDLDTGKGTACRVAFFADPAPSALLYTCGKKRDVVTILPSK